MNLIVKRGVVGVAGAVAVVALTAGSCGDKMSEPYADAPVAHHDTRPAVVIDMPDGFSNLAVKCAESGHVLLVSAFHGNDNRAAVTAVPDQSCP